jgi:predicted extracellular nuclease
VLTASATYSGLVTAIAEAGGPSYRWRDISPSAENADGGLPNGNIRVGILFNPKRITFIDRGSAGPTDAVGVRISESGLALTLSPARLAPSDAAWSGSRKPLVAEFEYAGQRLILIGCHLRSKVGDTSLFGAEQPPLSFSSSQRLAQAQVVARFVDGVLSQDPDARLVVLGDLNDFDFSSTLDILVETSLARLTDAIPPERRYSYVYDGNAQLLDHILVSPALETGATLEIVHVNADAAAQDRPTDHDPLVARLRMAP